MRITHVALAAIIGLSGLGLATTANAAAVNGAAKSMPSDDSQIQTIDYRYGGRDFCWYTNGWRGPGYYWCGYAFRRGYGWGGGYGWNGWGRGGERRDFRRSERFERRR
jgi:hypothetical protein